MPTPAHFSAMLRCLLLTALFLGAGLVQASCKDGLVLVNGTESNCMADVPGLLDIRSGQMSLGDAAFSHASLVVSAAGAQCGAVVGFAWGAGPSTPSKSIDYCERHLQTKLGKHEAQRMGCTCEVFLVPAEAKGRFRLVKPQSEFLAALQLSAATHVATITPKPPVVHVPTPVPQTTATASPPPIAVQRPVPAPAVAPPVAQAAPLQAPPQLATPLPAPTPTVQASVKPPDPTVAPTRPVARPSSPVPPRGRRFALVIGNAKYSNVPVLENSVNDAKAIAESLQSIGFKVSVHQDLTERAFNSAVRQFTAQLKGGEEVVFYFAGHGVQLGGSNFLLPTDVGTESQGQIRDESIDLQSVLDSFANSRAKFTLAMLDACRDNPFAGHGRSLGGRGLAPTSAATGQMILFSAGAGQQALDKLGPKDKDPNGVFTRVLLKELKNPGVPIDGMLRQVRNEVVRLAKSVGHEQVPALYDQTVGEFYMNPQ
jgi:hypothetical protein